MIAIGWGRREPPLAPTGVAAQGDAARAVAKRLLARKPEDLARLRGVLVRGEAPIVVFVGEAQDLPWAEGVVYLGRHPDAPSLWLPTTRAPSVAAALLERALLRKPGRGPHALLLEPPRLVPLDSARAVDANRLRAFAGVAAEAVP